MHLKEIDIIVWEIARNNEREFPVAVKHGILQTADIKHIFLKKMPDTNICIYLVWGYKSEGVINYLAADCICLDCKMPDISDAYLDKLLHTSFARFESEFDKRKKLANFRLELPELLPSVVEDARRQIIRRLPTLK